MDEKDNVVGERTDPLNKSSIYAKTNTKDHNTVKAVEKMIEPPIRWSGFDHRVPPTTTTTTVNWLASVWGNVDREPFKMQTTFVVPPHILEKDKQARLLMKKAVAAGNEEYKDIVTEFNKRQLERKNRKLTFDEMWEEEEQITRSKTHQIAMADRSLFMHEFIRNHKRKKRAERLVKNAEIAKQTTKQQKIEAGDSKMDLDLEIQFKDDKISKRIEKGNGGAVDMELQLLHTEVKKDNDDVPKEGLFEDW